MGQAVGLEGASYKYKNQKGFLFLKKKINLIPLYSPYKGPMFGSRG